MSKRFVVLKGAKPLSRGEKGFQLERAFLQPPPSWASGLILGHPSDSGAVCQTRFWFDHYSV